MRIYICLILLFMGFNKVHAQELNARVEILSPNLPNVNKQSLQVLQNSISNFLNNNKFSNDNYLTNERIECSLIITILAWDGGSGYKAEAQIQSRRPVFNTSYLTTLLNMSDKDFDFNYTDGQTIDFSDQNYISNISSLLSYYAYTIIGLDRDSFSKSGGTDYYAKAQNILHLSQAAGNKGWKAFDGLRNRYWLSENLLNHSFNELRTFIYNYHLQGLDQLSNGNRGLQHILEALPALQHIDKQKLGSIFPNIYFTAKAEESIAILSKLNAEYRLRAYQILSTVDPANIGKYDVLKR